VRGLSRCWELVVWDSAEMRLAHELMMVLYRLDKTGSDCHGVAAMTRERARFHHPQPWTMPQPNQ